MYAACKLPRDIQPKRYSPMRTTIFTFRTFAPGRSHHPTRSKRAPYLRLSLRSWSTSPAALMIRRVSPACLSHVWKSPAAHAKSVALRNSWARCRGPSVPTLWTARSPSSMSGRACLRLGRVPLATNAAAKRPSINADKRESSDATALFACSAYAKTSPITNRLIRLSELIRTA